MIQNLNIEIFNWDKIDWILKRGQDKKWPEIQELRTYLQEYIAIKNVVIVSKKIPSVRTIHHIVSFELHGNYKRMSKKKSINKTQALSEKKNQNSSEILAIFGKIRQTS